MMKISSEAPEQKLRSRNVDANLGGRSKEQSFQRHPGLTDCCFSLFPTVEQSVRLSPKI